LRQLLFLEAVPENWNFESKMSKIRALNEADSDDSENEDEPKQSREAQVRRLKGFMKL